MTRRRLGLGDCARLVAGGFIDGARNFPRGHVRAAFWRECAGSAVVLPSEVEERAVQYVPAEALGDRVRLRRILRAR